MPPPLGSRDPAPPLRKDVCAMGARTKMEMNPTRTAMKILKGSLTGVTCVGGHSHRRREDRAGFGFRGCCYTHKID